MNWQFEDAESNLSEVVEEARINGPQMITVRGKDVAVVLSIEEYRRIAPKKENLLEFFANSPLRGIDLEIDRIPDIEQDIAFSEDSSTQT